MLERKGMFRKSQASRRDLVEAVECLLQGWNLFKRMSKAKAAE